MGIMMLILFALIVGLGFLDEGVIRADRAATRGRYRQSH